MPASIGAESSIPTSLLSISVDNTIGATLLGTFFGLLFYGISLNQLYRYLRQFPTDDRFVQAIPENCATTVANSIRTSYFMAVSTPAQELAFVTHGLWSLKAIPISSAPIIFVTQMFFARRVWLIGPRYRLIIGIAIVVLLTEFGFAISISYKTFTTVLAYDSGGARWLISAGLTIAFATDLLFTPTLTVALWRSRRGQPGNSGIGELFSTYVINTGLLHWSLHPIDSIANAAASMTCLTTSPYSLVYGIPQMTGSRLYANSLLSALNSRDPQKAPSIFDSGSYGRNLIQRMNHRAAAETWNVPQIPEEPSVIHINVTTEDEGTRRDSAVKRGFAAV
ncbi:hypothetical protein V8D89_006781 [Ganoderma adspersum]